ncbi:amidohydrolase [Aquimarina macrocephali]|uniref:amidohydrolase n=1 Tax=Aquimarina macrocephali TaxID=666563 RepID=UPI000467AC16|nr:amidohydrolase [Aquimarina macrocephali]
MKLITFIITLMVSANSCNKDDNSMSNQKQEITVAYINGTIFTVNPERVWAEAIIVEGNKIIYVGNTDKALAQISKDTEVIDLKRATVIPGIHDVHMHPLEASSENFKFILKEGNDPENYAPAIRKALLDFPDEEWLLGWGVDLYTLLEAKRSPIDILDDISSTRPIAIMERTSHSIWVNSKALEIAGIDINSENPTGGIYMRDENDKLNGILIDNAGNLILDMALTPTSQTKENDYNGLVNFALPELAKNGITSICDARTYWKRDHHTIWKRVEKEGKLSARVNLGLWGYPMQDDESQISSLKSLYENDSNSLLKINQIKLYSDGIVHNTTAAMQEEYRIDLFQESKNNGLSYFTQNRITSYIQQLENVGFDFHIHAIGNRGVKESLNAIETASNGSGRHRITHVEIVTPSDLTRFSQLNVTADCQVAGDFTQPDQWDENVELIGKESSKNLIPIKSLKEADARITLSSDWDVSSINPFVGMQNAVTRFPQNITIEEAVKAYTFNGAYVMRQETEVGSIEVGKKADFVVLNQNIFSVDPNRIATTKVDMTVFDGEVIFERK